MPLRSRRFAYAVSTCSLVAAASSLSETSAYAGTANGRASEGATTAPGPKKPAPSQQPTVALTPVTLVTEDTVYTKNGGVVRGSISEMIANDRVTIRLASGRSETIAWANIERIERPANVATTVYAPIPAPTAAGPVPVPTLDPGATVRVHIESDGEGDVALEQKVPGSRSWRERCRVPCDVDVERSGEYRIGGGVRGSRSFHFPSTSGGATLVAHPASKGAFIGGIVLAGAGLLTSSVGLVMVVNASTYTYYGAFFGRSSSAAASGDTTPGWIVVGVGLAATAVGSVLFATNIRSKVDVNSSARSASTARLNVPVVMRTPEWQATRKEEAILRTTGGFVPTMSFSF